MKSREFAALLKSVTAKTKKGAAKVIDLQLVKNLDPEIKRRAVLHIVRKRQAILKEFLDFPLTEEFDSWLECMGYSYTMKNKLGFVFRGTQAHKLHMEGVCH